MAPTNKNNVPVARLPIHNVEKPTTKLNTITQKTLKNIKVPLTVIINKLKGDEDLVNYMSQEELNYIINLVNQTPLPTHIQSVDEIIDSVKNIIQVYFENKNSLITLGGGVVSKFISQKIRTIITQYKLIMLKKNIRSRKTITSKIKKHN